MAYRVTTEPVNRARPAIAHAHGSRAPDRTLTRNVTIASAALASVCLIAAGVAVLGRDHSAGSLPSYIASHKALKIAWVEPEQQAQFERNPKLAADPKADLPIQTASRFDAAFDALGANAPAIAPAQVPLPHAKPRKLTVAKLPAPEAPAAMRLMSYAPATREQLFAPEVTGSIGNPLRDLADKPTPDIPLPARLPHDKSSALKTKIAPEPVVKLAKPSRKLTTAEKLWGPVRVASLGPLDGIGPDGMGRDRNGIPRAPYDKQTAVYVITDKKVYMPDGSVLEAHSGLGDKMDDPTFAHMRMRGVTPPHVYDLKLREALFHGVEAIRMTPIGGEQAIFGRDGILAHSYMLGRSGQSNGCVSFKDYDEFLEAFKDGKINRLAVIGKLD